MHFLDHTLTTEQENLALDEALLLAPDTSTEESTWLRFWEYSKPFVVLGRSSKISEEVNVKACEQIGAPILRRVSGGATIVTGPGCLMYAVVLNTETSTEKLTVDSAHRYVLGKMTQALREISPTVKVAGTSDLVYDMVQPNENQPIQNQTTKKKSAELIKFSGNSVRLVRKRLLYHGTLLYDFELPLIEQLLLTPPRQPEYRQQRSHQSFVGNLQATRDELVESISKVWLTRSSSQIDQSLSKATIPLADPVKEKMQCLVEEKYQTDSWNESR